jgi:magnesium transporter
VTTPELDPVPSADSTLDLIGEVAAWVRRQAPDQAVALLARRHPAEVAQVLASLPPRERRALWRCLEPGHAVQVLAHLEEGVRADWLRETPAPEIARAVPFLDVDDAADLLQELPGERVAEVLGALEPAERRRVEAVLSYLEDTAGGLMSTDLLTVAVEQTVAGVLARLREIGRVPAGTDSLVAVDRRGRYAGVVELTSLLTAGEGTPLRALTNPEVPSILPLTPAHEVARLFAQRDLISAPVVTRGGVPLGRVTVDDVVDVVREEGEHTVMRLAGLDEADDPFAPVLFTARRRTLWLGVNLATALLAAWVIGLFEASLQQAVALAVLMPVVASMGGVAGHQTLTVVIRGLAAGHVGASNARTLLRKEVLTGLASGVLWALVLGVTAGLWFADRGLGAVIGVAVVVTLAVAASAGAAVPFALRALGIDPAVAGSVVLTAVTDVVGFLSFLGLGTVGCCAERQESAPGPGRGLAAPGQARPAPSPDNFVPRAGAARRTSLLRPGGAC